MAKLKTFFTNIRSPLSGLRAKAKINLDAKFSDDTGSNYKNISGSNEYFHTIEDLPLWNWIKCTNGELEYTRKGSGGSRSHDQVAWDQIYDDYIQQYGLGKMYERMLKTMHKKAIAELDYCITGDRFNLTQSEVQESILAGMLKNAGSGRTIEQTLIHLSKWIGQWIKPKEISAKEYFTLVKELENYNKINKPTDGEKNKH